MPIDLRSPIAIHLIGIGGSGMSGIAILLHAMHHQVSGSDLARSRVIDALIAMGIDVLVPHGELPDNVNVVARSTAIREGNPEVSQAAARGIEVISRSEILAAICAQQKTIAVAGTHGKTTTTAMLATIFKNVGRDPSWLVGGSVPSLGTSAHLGRSGEFVVEADESDGTFFSLGAQAAIVTNIEPDHLDYYGSFDSLRDAFGEFLRAVNGPRVVCGDDPECLALKSIGDVVTYGLGPQSDVRATEVRQGPFDISALVQFGEGVQAQLKLAVPGEHNLRNALGAITLATRLGLTLEQACESLQDFRQVERRFELKGEVRGAVVVDDYAHLPSEIRATLQAARQGGWSRVVAIFQPHRYSRTAALWPQFADAFVDADEVILTDVYPAGEQPIAGISGRLLVQAVLDAHRFARVSYFPERTSLADFVRPRLKSGDLVLTMGAGDISHLADELGAQ